MTIDYSGVGRQIPVGTPDSRDASMPGSPLASPVRSPTLASPGLGGYSLAKRRSLGYGTSHSDVNYAHELPGAERGAAGLQNLGNTCFMNSALQCLSQTPVLTAYFLSGRYKSDINRDNPIGTGGELAEAYADLVRKLWAGNVASVAPRHFKAKLGQFAQQFTGYRQQDSQELLAFLLDGLHEDLNRIRNKPYVEEKDSANRPDEEVAAEAWSNYRARNDSVIVDHFQGLYKSKLTCPKCHCSSVKFDPFMYLTLPLSRNPDARTFEVRLAFMDGSGRVERVEVSCKQSATARGFLARLRQVAEVPEHLELGMIEAFTGKVWKRFRAQNSMAEVLDADFLVAYAYPGVPPGEGVPTEPGEERWLIVYQSGPMFSSSRQGTTQLAALPLLVALPTWPADMPASESAERDFAFIRDGLLRALSPMALRNAPSKGQDDRASDAVDTEDGGSGVSRGGAGVEGSPGPRGGAAGPRGDGQISQAFEVFQDSRDATSSGQRLSLAAPRRRSNDGVSHTSSFPRYGGGDQVPGVSFASLRWSVQVAQWYDADAVARAYGVEGGTDRAGARAGRVTREVTLEQCLEAFSQHETLEPEDMWFCPKCKEFVQADKKMDLWQLPDVLVVHLKRFSYTAYSRDKLDTPMRFPIDQPLDMSPFVLGQASQPMLYDLYAVSNHYGGMGGGHYTAYAFHRDLGQWLCFDDSHVSNMKPEEISPTASYVLFYQRHGSRLPHSVVEAAEEMRPSSDDGVADPVARF